MGFYPSDMGSGRAMVVGTHGREALTGVGCSRKRPYVHLFSAQIKYQSPASIRFKPTRCGRPT